jgi:LPS export ABC transporter protein LptC
VSPRVAFGLATLAAVAAVYLLGQGGRTPDPAPAAATASSDMGYVARGATIVQTGEDGQVLYRVEADRIEQQPASGAVTAEGLTMRYAPPAQGDAATSRARLPAPVAAPAAASGWVLTARRADLPGGRTSIEMQGDVRVTGQPPGSRRELTIRTERLVYDTATTDIRTAEPVSFDFGPHVLTGRGLRANLKAGTLQIDSQVHGRIAP